MTVKKTTKSASTRQTSGIGYDFEDQVAAWLMVKMLSGVALPGVNALGRELQWQTEALGWEQIDDLLVRCQKEGKELQQLAISCKSNMQVSSSGLPADFAKNAWSLWHKYEPFKNELDSIALAQRGSNQQFFPIWTDLKNWCSNADQRTVMARINASQKHQKVFKSISRPKDSDTSFSEEDTIRLISRLEVFPTDFQFANSEYKALSLASCRELIQDGSEEKSNELWEYLVITAKNMRLVGGQLTLTELWRDLAKKFSLKNHPDFASSWDSIWKISQDYKNQIKTTLPTGFCAQRQAIEDDLIDLLKASPICAIYGGSGVGKSAFVKLALENRLPHFNQIWLSPEDLEFALAERTRTNLGILHPLKDVFSSTVETENIVVIDSAERINPDCSQRLQSLIATLLTNENNESFLWRIIIIGQTEAWSSGKLHTLTGNPSLKPIEVSDLALPDLINALRSSSSLSWLATDDDALKALSNPKTLAWVMEAEVAFSQEGMNEISIPAIADRLWSYWTEDKTTLQNVLVKLAEREALFERSFAISELGLDISEALDGSPSQFPLRKNQSTNRFEFEHDLAADWARFQRLKEIKEDISSWAPYASNPLWHNALRMLGQLLLRERTAKGALWDTAFEEAEKTKNKNPLAVDILLDALCLDPLAERYLNERSDMLFSDNGARLARLLKRFHHIATVPSVSTEVLNIDPSLTLYFEDLHRDPIYGRWPPIANFLSTYKDKVAQFISPSVAKLCETWLTRTPPFIASGKPTPYRKEFSELALTSARSLQLEQEKGHVIFRDDCEKPIYAAAFSAVTDMPEEVTEWALEMSQRKPLNQEIVIAVAKFNTKKRKEEAERLRTDKSYRQKRKQLRSMSVPSFLSGHRELPPWPLGPQGRVEHEFRRFCLQPGALNQMLISRPQVASEILLAMVIDDSPREDYSSSFSDDDLGLEHDYSCSPTAYWKSPFFQFFQLNSTIALDAFIKLVNFCTERWADNLEKPYSLEITFGRKKYSYIGGGNVFGWSHNSSTSNGQLYCALAALERWLCMEIDKEADVKPAIKSLLERTNSLAVIGVLIDVGKYQPELFGSVLKPLLSKNELYYADNRRVEESQHWFDAVLWAREGEQIFEKAKEWVFAPYRKTTLQATATSLINTHKGVADFVQRAAKKWEMPLDKKSALELRMLKAELDPNNYQVIQDQKTGRSLLQCNYPDELRQDIEAFNEENNANLQMFVLPYQCAEILKSSKTLTNEDADALTIALNAETDAGAQEEAYTNEVAIASTLLLKAESYVDQKPDLKSQLESILRGTISDIGETLEDLVSQNRFFVSNRALEFATYYFVDRWIKDKSNTGQWDHDVLRILTSNDGAAVSVLMSAAYKNKTVLSNRWWRLLQFSFFWSALCHLGPGFREAESEFIELRWARWLRWLRTRKLDVESTPNSVDPVSLASRVDRLKEARIKRLFSEDAQGRLKVYRRSPTGLDPFALKQIFSFLLETDIKINDDCQDERFLVQKLWEFEVWHRKRGEDDEEKDSLPTELGYLVLRKSSELLVYAPKDEAPHLWRPILALGVEGHHDVEHFIECWFLAVCRCQSVSSLSQNWRGMIEFGLQSSTWSPEKNWYEGERILRYILGFNSSVLLEFEGAQDIVLELKDLYERWAIEHLSQQEDNVSAFARFISSKAGALIRLDGLLWIKKSLAEHDNIRWHRDSVGSALIELLDILLTENAQNISADVVLRNALMEIAALLASKQISVALSLQEKIRLIR